MTIFNFEHFNSGVSLAMEERKFVVHARLPFVVCPSEEGSTSLFRRCGYSDKGYFAIKDFCFDEYFEASLCFFGLLRCIDDSLNLGSFKNN